MIRIHDYDSDPARMARRYHAGEVLPRLFLRERPHGRLLVLQEQATSDQPFVLSEFGGITYSRDPKMGRDSRFQTLRELEQQYAALLGVVRSLAMLPGFTQFTNTCQETKGLLFSDRTPILPIEEIARATRGISPVAAVDLLAAVGLEAKEH